MIGVYVMRGLNNKGFSFVELLGVVVIMGVILLLAIPSISRLIVDARKQAYIDVCAPSSGTIETVFLLLLASYQSG
jgi:prepilin-type N-terminal cleavage/methylation domain-containing protein